ncbi:MAG TPA: presqualene diphosphate synthase HpnD [Streptosporangiaceae bacterium]|nr:presqualene diphosphate synthase HpnD [Streptosporangiaceae bacterium]
MDSTSTASTAEAYRACEEITWSQARNFAYGIRLLPPEKRQSLAALYAFARRIDDIGDGTMAAPDKLTALEEARSEVLALDAPDAAAPSASDPVLVALADTARRFPVPMGAFGEIIDGCVADTKGATYSTFDDLHYYCRCVAGSVGRLSLGVFGADDHPTAESLADSLGVALQITNILRDIREDYQNGRVYLPAEDLDRFGVTLKPSGEPDPAAEPAPDAAAEAKFVSLIEFEAERARQWYDVGLQLLPMLDARSAACTGAMAGIYRKLLDRIIAEPAAVLHGRLSLSPGQKAMVAVRSLARPLLPRRTRAVDPAPPMAATPVPGRRP